MLPPFTAGKSVVRTVTSTATSYTFLGTGNQFKIEAASARVFWGAGSAGITARTSSAAGALYSDSIPAGAIQIFTRNPANDVKLSLVALSTTSKVYITEGSGQ